MSLVDIELTLSRYWPRGASYFCRYKSNQKGLQQRGFFAHTPGTAAIGKAFTLQNKQNHRLQLFCPASHALALASAKTCYASVAARSLHCSARIHPKLICCESGSPFKG
jgi:hypothetical protein